MNKRRGLILPALLLGVALIAIAIVYFVTTASDLPSFFPGHVSHADAEATHHHVKHGVAALLLGLGCLVFAWFQTGPAVGAVDRAAPPANGGE